MKIWIIGRSYPTPQNKMRGSFELEQAKMLAKHGHNVTYLAVILHPIHKVKKWGYVHFEDGAVQVYTDSDGLFPFHWLYLQQTQSLDLHIHFPRRSSVPVM